MDAFAVTAADIHRAADALAGALVVTPCPRSITLSNLVGADVFLKFENQQFTAAFKERGALNALLGLSPAQRACGVCAPSAGNHAQGLAYHAARLGIPTVIVMPRFTPSVKVAQTRALGAEVILYGDNFDEARDHVIDLVAQRHLTLVHPYDDARVIAGQGTVALEMLNQVPGLEILAVPVGGGGLIAGMAVAAHALAPGIELFGVETLRFPSMHRALRGLPPVFGGPTIADGIAVKTPGRLTLPIIKALVKDVLLVDEGHLEEALLLLLEIEKTVVEGAGAAALAALLAYPDLFRGRRVGLCLTGGNIDPMRLSSIVERGMVRTGRLGRIRVEVPDLPGALGAVTALFGVQGANIEEVQHQRAFTQLPLAAVEVDFVLRTRDRAHVEQILAALNVSGYRAHVRNQ